MADVPDSVLRSYVQRWCQAVAQQAERVANTEFGLHREMDCQLFAFALRQLLVAVELAAEETSLDAIDAAPDRFNESFPYAKDVRDQLVHFEAYEKGEGKLQKHPKDGLRAMSRSSGLLLPVTPFSAETAKHGWKVEILLADYGSQSSRPRVRRRGSATK